MSNSKYEPVPGYLILGGEFHVSNIEHDEYEDGQKLMTLIVSETRKNGQEDCHAGGEAISTDGGNTWAWEWESFSEWYDTKAPPKILKFLNANKHPDLESK